MDRPEERTLSAAYLRFAEEEAHGRSPLYEEIARGVAGDPETLRFLRTLPPAKRQPNLLLAAARHLFGTPAGWDEFRRNLLAGRDAVRAVMLARSTQTNEPGRCASLLPVLARLPQPLALLEVGSSAGLCLLPDFYGYDYGGRVLLPAAATPQPPIFPCSADGRTPIPAAMPQVVWRAGLDLEPRDVSNPDDRAWLEALVWPEQEGRLARLRHACAIAAAVGPRVLRGDLRYDLAALAAEAPREASLVVLHTAVLAYLSSRAERHEFARKVGQLCRFWISNEAPDVFPEVAAQANGDRRPGRFLLALNGRPVAWTDPHGATIEWIADPTDL